MGGFMGNKRCGQVARQTNAKREYLIKKGLMPKDFINYTTLEKALEALS